MASVKKLVVYPVKSCKGISVDKAFITPTGFRLDRHWVIADEAGKFMTQRTYPRLALIEVEVTPQEVLTEATPSMAGAELVLRAAGMPELRVPLDKPQPPEDQLVPVTVWGWSGLAADEGQAAAAWLTSFMGFPARLLRYAGQAGQAGKLPTEDPSRRQVDQDWAPSAACETAFADGFPFLLASEASLEDLNRCLPSAIDMNVFRANILLGGGDIAPWEEDSWQEVEFGGARLELIKPCSRCTVPTINQETALRSLDNEPTETLHTIRSGKVLGWTQPPPFKHSVFFGWNAALPAAAGSSGSDGSSGGCVAVGDALRVVIRREGPKLPRQ